MKSPSAIRISKKTWKLAKMSIKMSEELRFKGNIKRLTCSKSNGKYYISVIIDYTPPKPADNGQKIGLDWGIYSSTGKGHYFTGDQGQVLDLPDLSKHIDKIKFYQRKLSKQRRSSRQLSQDESQA